MLFDISYLEIAIPLVVSGKEIHGWNWEKKIKAFLAFCQPSILCSFPGY